MPVEFGLGKKKFVDQAIIRWLSGIIQKLKNQAVGQKYFVEKPVQLGPVQLSALTFYRVKVGFSISAASCLFSLL